MNNYNHYQNNQYIGGTLPHFSFIYFIQVQCYLQLIELIMVFGYIFHTFLISSHTFLCLFFTEVQKNRPGQIIPRHLHEGVPGIFSICLSLLNLSNIRQFHDLGQRYIFKHTYRIFTYSKLPERQQKKEPLFTFTAAM